MTHRLSPLTVLSAALVLSACGGSTDEGTGSRSAAVCQPDGDWTVSYASQNAEAGGEPQGSSDSLVLTFVSKNAASGTLDHSAWWWCGMHGQGMFDADAARATP